MVENPNIIDLDDFPQGANFKTINQTSLIGQGNINLQQPLISGTNIKSVNANSLLGEGDVKVQPTLVSGTNIKTVNNNSLLGSGNITVQPTLVSGTNIKTISGNSILGSGDIHVSTGKTVTTTYNNGTEWYRVWSDGWIEQGGAVVVVTGGTPVTFLKSFINTNYTALISASKTGAVQTPFACCIFNKTTTGITVSGIAAGIETNWYACGY